MNRQGPNGISWTDYTWNPVTGCWGPGGSAEAPRHCPYCYAKRIYERFGKSFEPRFHGARLLQPGKISQPSKIFVCSVGDLFGLWVPDEWVEQVLEVADTNRQHTFQFLTKWPDRLARWNGYWGYNCWVGATATDQPSMERALSALKQVDAPVRFVSAEPLLGPVECSLACEVVQGPLVEPRRGTIGGRPMPAARLRPRLNWLIIGAMTGPGAVKPEAAWVTALLACAERGGVQVWLKENLGWPERIQYWPAGSPDAVRWHPQEAR